jgi:ATP-binding cassette subfamily B protein
MSNLKKILSDILYVSKLTETKNKKVLILISVLFSQITALSDVFLIAIFANLIIQQLTNIQFINEIIIFVTSNKFLIFLVVVLRFFFQYQQNMILKRIEETTSKNLKVYILREIFSKRNYSTADSYYFINILTTHISFFYSSFASFLTNLLQIFVYGIYLFISNQNAVTIFLGGAFILVFPIRKLLVLAKNYMHVTYESGKEFNQEIQRVVENLFLIKILKKEDDEINRFSNTLERFKFNKLKGYSVEFINGYLPNLVTLLILTFILIFNVSSGFITLDFIGVTLRMFQALGNTATSVNRIINSQVHIEKFQQIEYNKFTINHDNYIVNDLNCIKFENVNFKYFNSEINIFENLSFEIKRNTHTLVVGENGSGKSTILGLIAGVFYANNGNINIFSNKLGYIGATPLIFDSTLEENLFYGNDLTKDSRKAIKFLEDLETFKEKENYDLKKIVSNKSLSSGQMQKIAFVRALVSDVEILLLDEATANLDEKSKLKIFELMENQNITVVNSTHDPDSFNGVDYILKVNIVNEKRIIDLHKV